jgi:hypothetical protein
MRRNYLGFIFLAAAGLLALPILAVLAVEPGGGVPTGLSPCKMTHQIAGCIANMDDPTDETTLLTSCSKDSPDCRVEPCCLLNMIYTVADWIFVILLVVAAIFVVWGGIEFVTSGGAPEKVGSARNKLIWALVGVVVAFVARGLVVLITQIIQK